MNPFEGWRITSPYGMRIHPIRKVPQHHAGTDLVKPHRYPIPAFVDGVVEYAGGNRSTGFGLYVRIRDKYNHRHYYAHLDEIRCKVGQVLKQGDIVGLQGTTGESTGSHLHYEIRKEAQPGTDVEPTKYLIDYFAKEEKALPEIEGKATITFKGKQFQGIIVDSVSYVPVRDLAQLMGLKVDWNAHTKTVELK